MSAHQKMTPSMQLSIEKFSKDKRNIRDIVESSNLRREDMITCIWQLRMARWMRKKEDRITCLRVLYQAVSILLCCHPNSTTLYHFFQDKISLLRDFVYILKTGPGSSEVSVNIPLDIRLLAAVSLCYSWIARYIFSVCSWTIFVASARIRSK